MVEITENLLFMEAKGFSMWPFLRQTDKLIIKKVTMGDLLVGDVILYQADGQLICHRLVKKARSTGGYLLYTRGDNSGFSPELITENMFLGKAIGIIRNGKTINLTGWKQAFINWSVAMPGPLVSWMVKAINRLYRLYRRFRGVK